MGTWVHFAAPRRRTLGGKRWLGGKSCQGRQPPKAGAAGPPLQGLPPGHTRPQRSTAGNISSAGCLKTGPQYTICQSAIFYGPIVILNLKNMNILRVRIERLEPANR